MKRHFSLYVLKQYIVYVLAALILAAEPAVSVFSLNVLRLWP